MDQQNIFQIFGHITVFYSTLDFFVTMFILELVSSDYKASNQPLKDSTTLGQKLRIIEKLGDKDVISKEILRDTKTFLVEAILVANERNRFMHDQWEFHPDNLEKGIIRRMAIVGLKDWKPSLRDSEPYTEADLRTLLARIGRLQTQFADAAKKLQALSTKL